MSDSNRSPRRSPLLRHGARGVSFREIRLERRSKPRLEPNDGVPAPAVSPDDLGRRLDSSAAFLAAARPPLEWAAEVFTDPSAAVYLVDREGVVLWAWVPSPEIARESGARAGVNWAESTAGINAAGSALLADEPVLALGSDNGSPSWRRYTAMAVPVHDHSGAVAGAVVAASASDAPEGDRISLAAYAAFAAERRLRGEPATDPEAEARSVEVHRNLSEIVRFRRLLDAGPDAAVIVDEDGTILYANVRVDQLLGYTPGELQGRPVEVLAPESLRGTPVVDPGRLLRDTRVGKAGLSLELSLRRRDRTKIPVEVSLVPLRRRQGGLVLAAIRDAGSRKETFRRLEIQYAVSRALAEAKDLADAGPRILEAIVRGMGWDVGELWLMDPGEKEIRASHFWSTPGFECGEFERETRLLTLGKGRSMAGRVWEGAAPLLLSDLSAEGDFARSQSALKAGLRSGFGFPVALDQKVIGIFGFFCRGAIDLDEETRRMLAALGSQVGQFIERRRAEDNLHRSEERFRAAIESAPSAILMVDPEGRVVLVNARAETMFGYAREEILGRSIEMLVPEALRQECCELRRGFRSRPEPRRLGRGGDLYGLRKDRSEIPLEVRVNPMAAPGGLFLLASIEDITERLRSERRQSALAELSKVLSETLDSSKRLESVPSVLSSQFAEWCVIDLKGPQGELQRSVVGHRDPARTRWARETLVPLTLNRLAPAGAPRVAATGRAEFYPRLGEPAIRAIGQDRLHIAFLREIGAASGLIVPLRTGERTLGALILIRCMGQESFDAADLETAQAMADRMSIAFDNARLHEELAVVNADLECRVRERTRQLEEALGEMNAFSYTIAHDLRAPLRAIASGAEIVLEERDRLQEEGRAWIERILEAANRMDALVMGLLKYSRLHRENLILGPVEWDQVVEDTLDQLKNDTLVKDAEIIAEYPFPRVKGHALTLTQALENLLSNALKFVPPDVRPRVRIRAERGGAQTEAGAPAPGWVRLWVEDNGIGIAPEHQERIFGVFERLHGRDVYPGTGIGLAIVRRVVERMGGMTGVRSEAGHGSRFFIELPGA